MGYEIKQQDWQALTEDAQREIYNYFLFIKQRYEIQAHTASNDSDAITLASHTDTHDDELPDDDVNKIWTISK